MARFLFFFWWTEWGKKKVTHGVGGKIRNEHKNVDSNFFHHQHTQRPLYGTIISLWLLFFFFFFFFSCASACVMPSSQSQTNRCQGAPYISDGVERLFTFFFLFPSHRRIHPRGEQRSSYTSVPKTNKPLFFFQLVSHKSLRAFSRICE